MARKKIVGPGKLKKPARPKAPTGNHPYKVRFGTPNALGETRTYTSMPKAKAAIHKEIESWKPWCQRYNNAGLEALTEALAAIDALVFHREPAMLTVCFDDHTQFTMAVEYWTTL